jgi:hypothetical protein
MEMSDISTLLQSRHYRFALTRSAEVGEGVRPANQSSEIVPGGTSLGGGTIAGSGSPK